MREFLISRYFNLLRRLFVYLTVFIPLTGQSSSQVAFKRGVNLTNWFQTSSPCQIQFTKFTRQDFENIKSLGCDVIRLPINLHSMTDGAPDYNPDQLFLHFLDQAVDWAEELELHLILDNHTFDVYVDTDTNVGEILVPVWTKMAEHFKNRSELIYYEVLNEPHGISDRKWNEIQREVVESIRKVDTTHTIIIGPASWNSYHNLDDMPVYDDDNLIYTFHFYDPFLFTHQGAGWTDLGPLSGVPFPFSAGRMPEVPDELKGTWVEGSLNNYNIDGTVSKVRQLIDIAADFQSSRQVPVFCGELGVFYTDAPEQDRAYWYKVVRECFEEKEIPWTIWDYKGGFGIFEKGGNDLFEYDLNVQILDALGLNVPEQKEYVTVPDSTGFELYSDYIAELIFESGSAGEGIINYYSETGPFDGKYCIYWSGSHHYSQIGFNFTPNKDLSYLVNNGYLIDFHAKCDQPGAKIDIRFIDTKTGTDERPWRVRKTLDNVEWTGEWQHFRFPLSGFAEQGSWDNGWYEPQGLYDWTAVDRFEIVAEHHDLVNIQFWFDEISVIAPSGSEVEESGDGIRTGSLQLSNYPNPFSDVMTIRYQLPKPAITEIEIFNVTGQKVRTLFKGNQSAGAKTVIWNGIDDSGRALPGGLYFYRVKTSSITETKKILLIK